MILRSLRRHLRELRLALSIGRADHLLALRREVDSLTRRHASALAQLRDLERATLSPADRMLAADLRDLLIQRGQMAPGNAYDRMLRRAAGGAS